MKTSTFVFVKKEAEKYHIQDIYHKNNICNSKELWREQVFAASPQIKPANFEMNETLHQ